MPRSGSGIYTQPFPNVVTDTTIESVVYNGFTRDVEATFNQPTPIVAGGTGANNAADALDNLLDGNNLTIDKANPTLILNKELSGQSCMISGQLAGVMRWRMSLGDVGSEAGADAGSDFRLNAYGDAGNFIMAPLFISRKTGTTTLSGSIYPATPMLVLNKLVNGNPAAIQGQYLGVARWDLSLGDSAAEPGGNNGSDLRINRYDQDGALTGVPLYINRRTGSTTLTADAEATVPTLALNKISGSAGRPSSIQGQTNGAARWQIALGDSVNETGFNQGSHFRIQRYDDTGTPIDLPMVIDRATGVVTFTGNPPDQKSSVVINKTLAGGTISSSIQGATTNLTRWHLALGDGQAEGGSNSGSDFKIHRYSDGGDYLSTVFNISRATGISAFFSSTVYKPGGGSFTDPSDARIKTVTGEYESGLAEVRQLHPVRYTFNGTDVTHPDPAVGKLKTAKGQPNRQSLHYQNAMDGTEYVGLIAQEAEIAMPELVTRIPAKIDGVEVDDYRVLDPSAMTWALVNCIKELAARVEALEAART